MSSSEGGIRPKKVENHCVTLCCGSSEWREEMVSKVDNGEHGNRDLR